MRTSLLFSAGVLLATCTSVALVADAAHAVLQVPPVTVFTDGGFGSGSLRAAISAANGQQGSSTIQLGAGTFELDLAAALDDSNVNGDLDTSKVITIHGSGRDATIIDAQSIGERAFHVIGGQLTLTNLTVKNGSTSSSGGAIKVDNGSKLFLQHVVLDSNTAAGNGGAIFTNGPLSILDSTLSRNKTTGFATFGGAITFISSGGSSLIDSSTLSDNTAVGYGGAIAGKGLPLIVSQSTFSGNEAGMYSALWNEGAAVPDQTWLLGHVTITDNTTASGGALSTTGNGAYLLKDVIVAGNVGGSCSANTFSKQGASVAGDASCGAASANLHVLGAGVSAGLYPLAANGGNTKTHALKYDSPALNITNCSPGEPDQRGIQRPSNPQHCDAGAYERAIHPADDPNQMADAGVATEIDVYANDLGTDGYTLGVPIAGGGASIVIAPLHGSAAFVSTHVEYTSVAGYSGPDTFTYRVCVALECGDAKVDVAVSGPATPKPPDPGPVTKYPTATQYVAISPTRILDTRTTGVRPAAGSTTPVTVVGVAGVPLVDVSAVVLNVTATNADAAGFVTVFPTGAPLPTASNLNVEHAGQTIPNLVTVPVGADGTVSLFTQSGADLLVDISGYYRVATDRTSGRFLPVDPTRLLDTRATSSPLAANTSVDIAVTGVAGVPAAASAVVVNVTATESMAAGFVTVWPAGTDRPVVSNVNVNRAGQTIANLAIVPVGADGRISVYSQSGMHLVVDITGWYTDATAAPSDRGLFMPLTPVRILDTRPDHQLPDGGAVTLVPTVVDGAVSALVLNVTATESTNPGYVTAWPTGATMPTVSNLNVENPGQTIPNASILGVGTDNSVDLFAQSSTHLVVDLFGFFVLD